MQKSNTFKSIAVFLFMLCFFIVNVVPVFASDEENVVSILEENQNTEIVESENNLNKKQGEDQHEDFSSKILNEKEDKEDNEALSSKVPEPEKENESALKKLELEKQEKRSAEIQVETLNAEAPLIQPKKPSDELKNATKKVSIKKKITNTNEYLAGAKLELYHIGTIEKDKKNAVEEKEKFIRDWVTDGDPYIIDLEPGHRYRIKEVSAPAGYKLSQPLDFSISNESSEIGIDTEYIGYRDNSDEDKYSIPPLFVIKNGSIEQEGEIVYCYNRYKQYPVRLDDYSKRNFYKKILAKEEDFINKASGRGKATKENIINVVLNGYPYNKSGIQEKYGLTDEDFRCVTQVAVWHFTDGGSENAIDDGIKTDNGKKVSFEDIKNLKAAYQELIVARDHLEDESASLFIYVTDNKAYQNLLSIEIEEPDSVTLYNEPIKGQERSYGSIRTTVSVGEDKASDKAPLQLKTAKEKQEFTIQDSILCEGLKKNHHYVVQGELYEIEDKEEGAQIKGKPVKISEPVEVFTSGMGRGDWKEKVSFDDVSLESGKKYVVFEYVVDKNQYDSQKDVSAHEDIYLIKHTDPNDKAQTIVVSKENPEKNLGKIKTMVSVGKNQASEKSALQLKTAKEKQEFTVHDSISGEGLKKNHHYVVQGELYEIEDKEEGAQIKGKPVKISEPVEVFTSGMGRGDWKEKVSFDDVSLESGKKYVVFEYVVDKNQYDSQKDVSAHEDIYLIKHTDPNDKAQTIVVSKDNPVKPEKPKENPSSPGKSGGHKPNTTPYLETKVSHNQDSANALNPLVLENGESIVLKDTILYRNFEKNADYLVQGKLYKLVEKDHQYMIQGEPVAVSEIEKLRTEEARGTWEKAITFKDVSLESGGRYVVYEYAILAEEAKKDIPVFEHEKSKLIKHENPNDKAQTIVIRGEEKPFKPEVKEEPKATPEKPVVTENKTEPKAPVNEAPKVNKVEKKENISPKTYVGSLAGSLVLLVLGFGAFIALERRRREK